MSIITKTDLFAEGHDAMSISRLTKKGRLGNLGYGFYVDSPTGFKLENDEAMHKINLLLNDFPFVPNRVVFSTISLNFCINQLISGTTYIVEVEREYLHSAFELLKENYEGIVLLKPDRESKINYWRPGAIYLTELFKRSPVNKDGTIAIEKLIVDLLFDKEIYSLYSGEDVDSAIDMLCSKYTINFKTLFSYAARKNRKSQLLARIRRFVPEELLEAIEND